MNHNSSNSRNTGRNGAEKDMRLDIQPVGQVTPALHQTQKPARNWAWLHNTETYDWMDSHSPFSTRDSFH